MSVMEIVERRPFCDRCLRPAQACFCAEISPIEPGFDLVILQHPKERKKTTASARIAYLCLKSARLIQGVELEDRIEVKELLRDSGRYCVVLYPGADAKMLERAEARTALEREASGARLTVFVIDGTWSTARTLLRRNPRIAALPRVAFAPDRVSEYGFKRQPASECLSTVEAVYRLVRLLAPQVDGEAMMSAFRAMVARQLAYSPGRSERDQESHHQSDQVMECEHFA